MLANIACKVLCCGGAGVVTRPFFGLSDGCLEVVSQTALGLTPPPRSKKPEAYRI
jgi:hypothetical protein